MIGQDKIDMKGRLTIQIKDMADTILREQKADNAIVTAGRDLVARLFIGNNNNAITHMAVGRGTTLVAPTDTALEDEIPDTRKELKGFTEGDLTTTSEGRKLLRVSMDLEPGDAADEEITEAALFNNDNNIMYNRVVFPVISKTDNIKLTLIWEIIF